MWNSRLLWKLALTYTLLNVLATAMLIWVTHAHLRQQAATLIEQRLQNTAWLLRDSALRGLEEGPSEKLQDTTKQTARKLGVRITLIGRQGEVFADSYRNSSADVVRMENHFSRPEVQAAATGGVGSAVRSGPGDVRRIYVAVLVEEPYGPAGFIRTAVTASAIDNASGNIPYVIGGVSILFNILAVGLTYPVVRRFMRPAARLTESARAISRGDYTLRSGVQPNDELGVLAVAFDRMSDEITARLAQLRETNGRLATVLAGMTEGVIAVDSQQNILLANRAAGQLFGFEHSNIAGRPFLEVVRNRSMQNALVAALESSDITRSEVEVLGKVDRQLQITSSPLPGEDSDGVVMVLHDVTDLRRLETLRQEFVANVSHELKTPLSAIQAFAETLHNGGINDQENNLRFVIRIEEQAERLHQLILDMLSIARMESGSEIFDMQLTPLPEVAANCFTDHEENARASEVDLRLAPDLPGLRVWADEEGLRQIIDNLLDNAIKYNVAGGKVELRWREEDGFAVIEVEDNGIGIAMADQARVFERLFRVDKARSREKGSTGLGLAIVKHLVGAFNGELDVTSRLHEGTTFTVKLLLHEPDAQKRLPFGSL